MMFARPKLLLVSFEAVLSSFRLSLDQLQGPTLGLLSLAAPLKRSSAQSNLRFPREHAGKEFREIR